MAIADGRLSQHLFLHKYILHDLPDLATIQIHIIVNFVCCNPERSKPTVQSYEVSSLKEDDFHLKFISVTLWYVASVQIVEES